MCCKTYCFAFQKRLFCIAKQPLSQCQIEIIVFLQNNLYKTEVFSALDETNALRQSTY